MNLEIRTLPRWYSCDVYYFGSESLQHTEWVLVCRLRDLGSEVGREDRRFSSTASESTSLGGRGDDGLPLVSSQRASPTALQFPPSSILLLYI